MCWRCSQVSGAVEVAAAVARAACTGPRTTLRTLGGCHAVSGRLSASNCVSMYELVDQALPELMGTNQWCRRLGFDDGADRDGGASAGGTQAVGPQVVGCGWLRG